MIEHLEMAENLLKLVFQAPASPVTVGGEEVTLRVFDPEAMGEYGFVFQNWRDSWLFNWSPWPRLSDWERQPDHWRKAFLDLVKGKLHDSRVKKPYRAVWIKNSTALIRQHMALDTVVIACLKNDPSVLVGFGCFRPQKFDKRVDAIANHTIQAPVYIFVERKARNRGVGTLLLRSYGARDSFRMLVDREAPTPHALGDE